MDRHRPDAASGTHWQELRLFVTIAVLVVVLDQVSKLLVKAALTLGDQVQLIPGFLDLVLIKNYGAAFGILQGQTALIISISLLGLLIISVFLHHFPPTNRLGIAAFSLIMGGTVGNLVDRIRPPHYVVDFIRVHLHANFSWPAFNVADAAMTIGILALILYFYRAGLFRRAYERTHKPES
ncbi:MAG: signal peptidase II [Dehalococcoidia bacterium]